MKILEIIKESVEAESAPETNAEDILYLLDNVGMRPEELADLANSLKQIVGDQQDISAEPEPTEPTIIANQPPAEEPVTAEPEAEEPLETDDGTAPEETELQERTQSLKRKKVVKASSYREQIEQYLSQITNDEDLKELNYSIHVRKFKDLAKKIVANKIKSKATESYRAIEAIIPNLGSTIDVTLMTDFLNDCLTVGVIDTPSMIGGSTASNKIPLSNPAYEPIIKALLEITLPGGAAVGKGEIGMAFAGIDTVKETTDITVGKSAVEVKASQGTSDFYMKGTAGAGFANHMKGLKELVSNLNDAGANFKPSNEVKNGGIAQFNDKTVNVLQPYFKKMGAEKTLEVIMKVLRAIHKNEPEMVNKYEEEIALSIKEDGSIDYELLTMPTAKLNFEYYKAMSGHDGVLMINIDAFTYFYVDNPESFADLVSNGTLKIKGAIEFRTNSLGGLAYFLNPVSVNYNT
jgi:hypothetical protein